MFRSVKKFLLILSSAALCAFAGAALADTVIPETWADLAAAVNSNPETAVTVNLDRDITAGEYDSPLVIPKGKTVTINLNGHALDRGENGLRAFNEDMLTVSDGAVCVLNGTGTLSDAELADSTAFAYTLIVNQGTLTVDGGVVLDAKSLCVENKGSLTVEDAEFHSGTGRAVISGQFCEDRDPLFTLNGGTISGLEAAWDRSGPIHIYGGPFTMNGGSITNNTCNAAPITCEGGTVTITGGTISGNVNSDSAYSGGAVASRGGDITITGGSITGNTGTIAGAVMMGDSSATLTITGGTIMGNTGVPTGTFGYGGGVISLGTVKVSGSPQITGNMMDGREGEYNLYASCGNPLHIDKALTEDALIGLSLMNSVNENNPAITEGMSTKDTSGKPFATEQNIVIDRQPETGMILFHNGEYMAVPTCTLSFTAGAGTGSMGTVRIPRGIAWPVPECGFNTPAEPAGTVFEGWEYGGTLYEPGSDITVNTETATLTARWLSPWGAVKKAVENRGTREYTLTQDLVAASWDMPIMITRDVESSKSFDLNGHMMDASAMPEAYSCFFSVGTNMSFTIQDSAGGGTLTGATGTERYPVEVLGALFFQGGNITGNRAGGVKCGSSDYSGTVWFEGGSITANGLPDGNSSSDLYGYGVNVVKGTLKMESGEISGNTQGVRLGNGNLEMTGGSITGNRGAGVLGSGYFDMSGGSVTGNYQGVSLDGGIRLAGAITISGNGTASKSGQDVVLQNYQTVSFIGKLDATARIGIQPYMFGTFPYIFTADLRYNGEVCAVPENFFCPSLLKIGKTKDTSGRDRLICTYGVSVTYDANGGSGGNHPTELRAEGMPWQLPECTFTAPERKTFDAWEISGVRYAAGATVTVTAETTVKALWKDLPPVSFAELQVLLDAGGTVTLNRNVTGAYGEPALTVPAGRTTVLDLNGFTINRADDSEGVTLSIPEGAQLTIRDSLSGETGVIAGSRAEDAACIVNRGMLVLQGGTVDGSLYGGIDNYGALTMTGGTIAGSVYSASGTDAVPSGVTNRAGGTFTMPAGSISVSGGRAVWNAGTFTLSGGTITGNDAAVLNADQGIMRINAGSITRNGSVDTESATLDVTGGSVRMAGGTIDHNTTRGGVFRLSGEGSLTMTGGAISYNNSCGVYHTGGGFTIGGDVSFVNNTYPWNSYYTCDVYLQGGRRIGIESALDANLRVRVTVGADASAGTAIPITDGYLNGSGNPRASLDNFTDATMMYKKEVADGEVVFTIDEILSSAGSWAEVQEVIDGMETGAYRTVLLSANAVRADGDEALTVPAGKYVTIDLYGHTLNGNGKDTAQTGSIVVQEGAKLTIRDSFNNGSAGKVTGGCGCVVNHGTLVLESGSIESNDCEGVVNDGLFRMTGGKIKGNQYGVRNQGEMEMTGGTITENTQAAVVNTHTFRMSGGELYRNWNGAVLNTSHTEDGAEVNALMVLSGGTLSSNSSGSTNAAPVLEGTAIDNTGTVRMTGGTILNHNARSAVRSSGAAASLTITGGEIRNNRGFGVDVRGGTFALGGNVQMKENGAGYTEYMGDINLYDGGLIRIAEPLPPGSEDRYISVRLAVRPSTDGQTVIPFTEGCLDENGESRVGKDALVPFFTYNHLVMKNGELAFSCWESKAMDAPDLILPPGIRSIEAGAFAGTAPRVVYIPEKGESVTIEAGAFADCTGLLQVYIPANVTVIGTGAFDTGHQIEIFGLDGTEAEAYAIAHDNCTFIYAGH